MALEEVPGVEPHTYANCDMCGVEFWVAAKVVDTAKIRKGYLACFNCAYYVYHGGPNLNSEELWFFGATKIA